LVTVSSMRATGEGEAEGGERGVQTATRTRKGGRSGKERRSGVRSRLLGELAPARAAEAHAMRCGAVRCGAVRCGAVRWRRTAAWTS
jgi:hypothetical protein